ncbi:hypothetical protein D3C72_561640 [compost metagenome]
MTVQNLIKRRHPAYEALLPHWQFLIDTYEATVPEWVEGHIHKFYKEGPEEYKERKARAWRDNVSRDIVEIWTSHLFKVPVVRDGKKAPAPVVEFWKHATRGADAISIDDLMREASDKSGAVSPCYLVVDMPAAPELEPDQVLTQAHAQALKLRPYAYVVYPVDALDFGLDDDDEFTWFLLREWKRDDEDPFEASGALRERFRLWTRTHWYLFERVGKNEVSVDGSGVKLIEEGEHPLGRVPVVQLYHKKGKDRYRAISLLEEIAYKDRALANKESQLDAIICDQTFSQLAIPDAGLIASSEKTADGRRQKMLKMGTRRVFLFNDQAKHAPMFLSPDASQGQLVLTVIDRLRQQIYEDALLDSQARTRSGGPRTATEAEQDFEKLGAALAEKAKSLEAAERKMAELVCLWTKSRYEPAEVASWVTYPRKFNVKALAEELDEALKVKQLGDLGGKFWELYLGRLVRKLLPELTDAEFATVLEEIRSSHELKALLMPGAAVSQVQAPQGGAETQDAHDEGGEAA